MLLFLLISSLVYFTNANPLPNSRLLSSRIIGGDEGSIISYPYLVSVQVKDGHWCGGSIISDRHVLTAAHCVLYAPSILYVRAGSTVHNKYGSFHHVDWNVTHDDADLAVLRVKESFVFDETRQKIQLFERNEIVKPGTVAVASGWGVTNEYDTIGPNQLRFVNLPIVTRQICNNAYKNTLIGEIVDGQICAGYPGIGGKDACQGDSGGPLVVNNRQIGIVSMGFGCANPKYPGIYTDVAYYRHWIDKQITV